MCSQDKLHIEITITIIIIIITTTLWMIVQNCLDHVNISLVFLPIVEKHIFW